MAGSYGNSPWGSNWGASGGTQQDFETLPVTDEWDVFDLSGVRQPDDMARVDTFVETELLGDGSQFFSEDNNFNICSGGTAPDDFPTSTGILLIDKGVTENFTVEYRVSFSDLPPDFDDVTTEHIYLGAWSSQDFAAGFFFSQVGIRYTGALALEGSNNIVDPVDAQNLPGSSSWFSAGEELIIRIAVNAQTQICYLFVSNAAEVDGGSLQTLRAILVAQAGSPGIPDAAQVSVRGTSANRSCIELFNYQLSTKFLVGDLPPVADAGEDQAVNRCSIVQLDGGGSLDPEGNPLAYEWRLIDAPQGSVFEFDGEDGSTQPDSPATGFTTRFFSTELESADTAEPIHPGDVITYAEGSFTITSKGSVGNAFYVEFDFPVPDDATNVPFKLIRQVGISGPTEVRPTFYPDKAGFYVFDLRVNDGELSSSPQGTGRSSVLVNVVESALPRGCPVDANFMFDYMLSYWKLVEDRDRIETYFEAVSRVAASELYTLWQVEYSKSLRDIQRTFVRRWLHYDLLLPEPLPELTRIRTLWGGAWSNPISGGVQASGRRLVVSSPRFSEAVEVTLTSAGRAGPARYAGELQAQLRQAVHPSFTTSVSWSRPSVQSLTQLSSLVYPTQVAGLSLTVLVDGVSQTHIVGSPTTPAELVADLQAGLPRAVIQFSGDTLRISSPTAGEGASIELDETSTLLSENFGPIGFLSLFDEASATILVNAQVPFTFTSLSTAPGFTYPRVNSLIGGLGGEKVSERTLRVEYSLAGMGIEEDDLVVIDRSAYRVVRVVDDERDVYPFQRIVLKDALPPSLDQTPGGVPPAVEWVIPGWVQSELLSFYDGLVDRGDVVDFEAILDADGAQVTELVETTALGVSQARPNRLAVDTAALAAVTTGEEQAIRLARVFRKHYVPVDSRIVDVPVLTDVIALEDPDEVLRRNVDFFLESFRGRQCLRFSVGAGVEPGDVWEGQRPPDRLWAEYTFLDNEDLIEANFGVAVGLTRDRVSEEVDYLSAVRGIWYALYNGPTVRNLRIAVQIFLGLPFAEVAGTIEEIRVDFFSQRSRMLIRDSDNPEIVRSYIYPKILEVEENPETGAPYAVGDTVEEFAPLVTGAEISDWVKNPAWYQGIINQGAFSEVQKYHTFLVRVDSDAFNLEALGFAQQFVSSIKPVYTDPLYVILFRVGRDGDEIDVIDDIGYNIQICFEDNPCCTFGMETMFDQPWASPAEYEEGVRNQFDTNSDPQDPSPSYPGPSDDVDWGFDKNYLCPDDDVQLLLCENYVNEVPRYDSIWKYDVGPTQQLLDSEAGPLPFPQTFDLGPAPNDTNITKFFLQLNGPTAGITEGEWVVEVLVDGVAEASQPLVLGTEVWAPGPVLVLQVQLPQNVDVMGVVSVPALAGQNISLRVRPLSNNAQNPGWTSFNYAVNYDFAVSSSEPTEQPTSLWQFDADPVSGTFCATTESVNP